MILIFFELTDSKEAVKKAEQIIVIDKNRNGNWTNETGNRSQRNELGELAKKIDRNPNINNNIVSLCF